MEKETGVLTTGQAAKVCGCSLQTIIRCIDRGILKGFRIPGSSHRRVKRTDLVEFLEKGGVTADGFFLTRQLDKRVRIFVIDRQGGLASKIGESLRQYCQLEMPSNICLVAAAISEFKPHIILIGLSAKDTYIFSEILSFCEVIRQMYSLGKTKIIAVVDGSQPNDFSGTGFDGYISTSGDDIKDAVEVIMMIVMATKNSSFGKNPQIPA